MTGGTVTPEELMELLGQEPAPPLIDVRVPAEFRAVHVIGARNVPLNRLSADELRAAADGLVFAGVTDTCGMGMLLAKMPWNRS